MAIFDAKDAYEKAIGHFMEHTVFPQIERVAGEGHFSTQIGPITSNVYADSVVGRLNTYGYKASSFQCDGEWYVEVAWDDGVIGSHMLSKEAADAAESAKVANETDVCLGVTCDERLREPNPKCEPGIDKCTWCVFGVECPDSVAPHKKNVLAAKYSDMASNVYADLQQSCKYGIGNGFDWYAEYSVSKYYGIYFGETHVIRCTKPNHKLELEFMCYRMTKDMNVWEPHVRVVIERKERPDSYGPVFNSVHVYPATHSNSDSIPMYMKDSDE